MITRIAGLAVYQLAKFRRLADTITVSYFLNRSFFVKLAPVWVLVLVAGSLLPQEAKVALGTCPRPGQPVTMRIAWTHRLAHYGSFGSTALLLILIARSAGQRRAALASTGALGVGIEVLQHVIYKSAFEPIDARDDVFAACAVYLIVFALRHSTAGERNYQQVTVFPTTLLNPRSMAVSTDDTNC